MSNNDQNMEWLYDKLCSKPWLSEIVKDKSGRYIVYVNRMGSDVIIPDFMPDGTQILCHFAYNEDNYINRTSTSTLQVHVKETKDLAFLQDELYDLEVIFGEDVENVFYEIVDGVDAITNKSDNLPVLRAKLDELYSVYGFDAMQEIIG